MQLQLDKKLFFANQSFNTKEEILDFISDQLQDNGYVNEKYKENIIKRESEYPTGLNSDFPRVAIPHTDYIFVNNSTLGFITLNNEVMFGNMENSDEEIPIKIVIVMALNNPSGQLDMLQKIMGIVQEKEIKEKMLLASSNEELFDIVNSIFN